MRSIFRFAQHGVILGMLLLAFGHGHTAQAQLDPGMKINNKYLFSTIGVARGQLARLSVFYHNVFPPGPCMPGGTCTPTGSFAMSLNFSDCEGNIVGRTSVTLIPDKGWGLVFAPTSFMTDGRACARASVTVEPDANGFLPDLVPSVEVLDASTGQSALLNPGAMAGFNPIPPIDFNFGLFNVIKGQTARISAAFVDIPDGFPPGPCRVTLSFYGGDGQLISQSIQTVDLGKTAQFDFPTTGFPDGARARIRASVHVDPSERGLAPCIMPAVEVFNNDTGKGTLYYPGVMMESY
jgi:hypothetical protein